MGWYIAGGVVAVIIVGACVAMGVYGWRHRKPTPTVKHLFPHL